MRIETKLTILDSVLRRDTIHFDTEHIMGGQRYIIRNWRDIRNTIDILSEMDWLPEDEHSQLLADYLANRAEADALELAPDEYHQLVNALQRFQPGLPAIRSALRVHAVTAEPSTIWVQLNSNQLTPKSLSQTLKEIADAFTRLSQAGETFHFVGVAQGSDWFGFNPSSPEMGTLMNCCIHLASSIVADIKQIPISFLRSFVKLNLSDQLIPQDDDVPSTPTDIPEADIDEAIANVNEHTTDRLIHEGVEEILKQLDGGDSRKRDAVKKATKSIIQLMQDNKAAFEPSENSNITINIRGEHVEVYNLMPHNPEALPPHEE